MHQPTRALPFLVLSGGILMAATSSIMIRFAQGLGMPSLTIAAGRLGLAALILLPLALLFSRRTLHALCRRDLLLALASGAFLAVHFAAWISSLAYTSVASSVALVGTNPLWVGLAAALLLRERLPATAWWGILATIGGTALIAYSDGVGGGPNATLGNGLALLGAIAGSGYFLIGRGLRQRMATLPYIFLVYTTAAVVLLVLAAAGSLRTGRGANPFAGYPPLAYLLLLGLALGPQLLGHTSFNWALRFLPATVVAVVILGEPIGSAALALLFFGEWFRPLQLLGFVVLLAGIVVTARAEPAPPAERADAALV